MVASYSDIVVGQRRRELRVGHYRLIEASYPGARTIPRHCHERSNVTIVLSGLVEECAEGQSAQHGPGSVVIKPAGTIHSNRFPATGALTFVVELPAHDVDLGVEGDFAAQGYGWRQGGPLVAPMLRLAAAVRTGCPDDALEDDLLLVSSLLTPDSVARHPAIEGDVRLEAVRALLHDQFAAPIRVSTVAGQVGLHPVYLARVFRRRYGMSVTDYVARLRVAKASSLLSIGEVPITQVAIDSGFCDQAHLCRVFKTRMGVTPGEFRRVTTTA